MAIALFMNAATYRRSLGRGRPFQDRRKQGCLREAPMDGFTAFLKRPPPGQGFACHPTRPFMNNATRYWDTSTGPNVTARD